MAPQKDDEKDIDVSNHHEAYAVGTSTPNLHPLIPSLVTQTSPASIAESSASSNVRSSVPTSPGPETSGIAICGLAFRLPGGVRDSDAFWDVLVNGKDMRSTMPSTRYNSFGFGSETDHQHPHHGYFLDEDLAALDTSFFNMRKNELEETDPQQRQLLEVTRECLEDACEVDYRGKSIGCYVGAWADDWQQLRSKDTQSLGGNSLVGFTDFFLANRISYEYDFQGPSLAVKTGCSASLVALHEACRALENGDCESAIVAGTNLIMSPVVTSNLASGGVLSPEGSSKSFDASADGYARGEAVNAIFIKRLDDAVRDGNPIRAVIRGTGVNSDGRGHGLLTPNGKAQEALIRKVYSDSGLNPQDTGFFECHGTGTATGDPIETQAVGNVFGEHGIFIGAVKPNVGHSESASGLTSLIKAILALENKTIPPNIKFKTPNPRIKFEENRLVVPVVPTPFPIDRAERVSISSYGIGGSNSHVIVDSLEQVRPDLLYRGSHQQSEASRLLVFSANTQTSLQQLIANYDAYLEKHPDALEDLSYTLAMRREKLVFRAYSVSQVGSKLTASPFLKRSQEQPPIAMVFSGQGAQWAQMGHDLIKLDRRFRADILIMDDILQSLRHPPEWTIEEELQKPFKESRINRAELAQPLCTAIQIALVNAYARCGIVPSAVIGHSSGEIAATYAAGGLSSREAIIIAYYRGFVTKKHTLKGAMAAVGLGASEVSQFLLDGVGVACENSPTSVTISGDLEQVRRVMADIKIKDPEVLVRELKVDMAYHSHHMKALGIEYLRLLQSELGSKFTTKSFQIPMFSTVSGSCVTGSWTLSLDYWRSNLVSPVLFSSTSESLLSQFPTALLLEVGPHSTLAGPLREIATKRQASHSYIPTMLRFTSSRDGFLSALGQLYQHGVDVNFSTLSSSKKALCNLPAYPWDRTSYTLESRVSKEWRSRPNAPHPLLGERVPESSSLEPSWRVVLKLEDQPWLRDHKVRNDVVFPLAGFITMAGEAVKQLSGVQQGYALRHVVIHTALVLMDSKPIEIFTNFRPYRLTDVSKSTWYDFSICSYAGTSWVEHCHGQVRIAKEPIISNEVWPTLANDVTKFKWYNYVKQLGLVYGPDFQGLTSLQNSTKESVAIGQIEATTPCASKSFSTHPCVLDSSFQLLLLASAKGSLNSQDLYVPTMVEELYISTSPHTLDAKAWISDSDNQNGVDCVADGKVAIRLRNMRLGLIRNYSDDLIMDRHAAAHLHWSPDIDFVEFRSLFEVLPVDVNGYNLVEEMTLLCILDTVAQLEGLTPAAPFLEKLANWLRAQALSVSMGTYTQVPEAQSFMKLSAIERSEAIHTRFDALSLVPLRSHSATGLLRLFRKMPDILRGKVDPLELLLQDDVLTEIYNSVSFSCGKYVQALANKKPNLRILEVGAGTGSTTARILSELSPIDSNRNPSYSVYTFTDISAGFFDRAKERFSDAPNIEYKMFDISRNPLDQGFELQSYDLIIATNCIHATPKLKETLQNLHSLLRPNGNLLLSEVCSKSKAPNYIWGTFSGWWVGQDDDREESPLLSLEQWDTRLKDAGFAGAGSSVYDTEDPYQYCVAITAQPNKAPENIGRELTVLCGKPLEGPSQKLIEHLRKDHFEVKVATFGQDISQARYIVSTLDLEAPFFDDIEERFDEFKEILRHNKFEKFLWLLPPTQIRCENPHAAKSLGMLRIARAELVLPIATLEINVNEPRLSEVVTDVFGKLGTFNNGEKLLPDIEFAFDDGVVKTGRFHPFSLETALKEKKILSHSDGIKLEIEEPGLLDTLKWIEKEDQVVALKGDEVEIETRAVGLNFKDLALSLGIVASSSKNINLGLELSGIVRRAGSDVTNVSVGDRIFASAEGLFASSVVLSSLSVTKIPDSLGFDDAATMPACYATVIRALLEVGQLEKDQTILIHSACGGVGHAAIQVSKYIGAEVFATVSSEKKIDYLVETFGIPRDHIFYSRDDSFLHDLLKATNGKGADLVLNSLSGELLQASWKAVAEFGKLVELGRRDLAEFGKLNMEPFLANRSYCCVDLAQIMTKLPAKLNEMLVKCVELYELGAIQPIHPVTIFEASDIQKAFRYLERGDHIGKAIVRMPSDISKIPSVPNLYSLRFDPESSYLITGGLGGLGQPLLTWMMDRGARYFILISRSAGSRKDNQEFIAGMEARGCSVTTVAGLVQDENTVIGAIEAAQKPVKGVIHLATALRDAPILDMTFPDWDSVVTTKCTGAWNLHNALRPQNLDFFILASSIVSQIECAGQSNYSAANTFLDAFCQYRHSLGLPASVINICPINDAGMVAENETSMKSINAQGLALLSQREFLDFVELAVLTSEPQVNVHNELDNSAILSTWHNPSQLVMGLKSPKPLSDPSNQTSWRRDRRMGFYHNVLSTSTSQPSNASLLSTFLSEARANSSVLKTQGAREFLAVEIGTKILTLMLRDAEGVKPEMKMEEIGLDSLMVIELRRWWRQAFGVEVSSLELLGVGTLVELGELAARRFGEGLS